jgi:uncharacterized membrane protein YhfC
VRKKLLLFLAGLASFGVSQLVLRIPLLKLFYDTETYLYASLVIPMVMSWIIAFTAGLFEETGRLVFLQFFKKSRLSLSDAVTFGLGHGLMEAGWLLTAMVQYIVSNGFSQNMVLGLLERVFALIIQVSLAILVVMAVNGRRIRWYLLALLLHTVVDGILPYFTSAVVLEAALGMESLGILALSLALWRRMQKQSET